MWPAVLCLLPDHMLERQMTKLRHTSVGLAVSLKSLVSCDVETIVPLTLY
jgi:hypothetical protein